MKKKIRRRRFVPRPISDHCRFCKTGEMPDYKKWEVLSNYITDRGKVLVRGRSALCAKHQRHLTIEIKRARHLALLPFVVKPL